MTTLVWAVIVLGIIAAVEACIITWQSKTIDEISDKLMDAMQDLEPITIPKHYAEVER